MVASWWRCRGSIGGGIVASWWRHSGVVVAAQQRHSGVTVASWWQYGSFMVALVQSLKHQFKNSLARFPSTKLKNLEPFSVINCETIVLQHHFYLFKSSILKLFVRSNIPRIIIEYFIKTKFRLIIGKNSCNSQF